MKMLSTLLILVLTLSACGTLQVSLDQTPTPDNGPLATVSVLQTQVSQLDPLAQTLGMDSSAEHIRRTMLYSHLRWTTAFIDGTVTWNLTQENGAQPQQYREQIWIDQASGAFRRIGGLANMPAQYFYASDGLNILEMDLQTGQSQSREHPAFASGTEIRGYTPSVEITDTIYRHPLAGTIGSPFDDLLLPSGLGQRSGDFEVIGLDTVAAQKTLVVDWFWPDGGRPSRYWIDVNTGVILKQQDFGKAGGDVVLNEYVVNEIVYDFSADSTLFSSTLTIPPQYSDVNGSPLASSATPAPYAEGKDPLGMVYFFARDDSYPQPNIKLLRLPGSCVAAQTACPAPEEISAPFPFATSLQSLSWAPDGRLAAFNYPIAATNNAPTGLWIFDPATQAWSRIAEFPYIDPPLWSQDGKWLAFRAQDGQGGEELYAIQPDGSGLTRLTGFEKLPAAGQPYLLDGWLGQNVILRSGALGVDGTVYLVRAPDGAVKPLFDRLITKAPFSIAPDGSFLAYAEQEGSKIDLKLLTPDGSTLRTLATFQANIYPILWSTDGQTLAFVVYDELMQDVYVIQRDGTNLRQVYRSQNIARIAFSPDGRYLLVQDTNPAGEHLFVVTLDTLGQHMLNAPGLPLDWHWLEPSWTKQ